MGSTEDWGIVFLPYVPIVGTVKIYYDNSDTAHQIEKTLTGPHTLAQVHMYFNGCSSNLTCHNDNKCHVLKTSLPHGGHLN